MHVLIIGAAGMVGRKLAERLAKEGRLGEDVIARMTLHDIIEPASLKPASFVVETLASDFSAPGEAEKLVVGRPDVIFHLAAIVSAEAEADFDKGYRINLDGTRQLFEAVRQVGDGYAPRLVFTSSIAVFGAPFPDAIGDEFLTAPLTSYGTQKAIGELLYLNTAGAVSTASGSGCPRSASGRVRQTTRLQASSPTSSASRLRGRKLCCRCRTT